MASNLKFTMKRHNGADLDNLYPMTTWSQVQDKPATYTPTAHTHTILGTLASGTYVNIDNGAVRIVSSYDDLTHNGSSILTKRNYYQEIGSLQGPLDSSITITNSNSVDFIGNTIVCQSGGTVTITISNGLGSMLVNEEINFLRYAGAVTFVAASGVTIRSVDNKKTIAALYQFVTLKKMGDDEFLLFGALS